MNQSEVNVVRVSRRAWAEAGLSDTQLWNDSRRGKLRICGRGEESTIEIDPQSVGWSRLKSLGLSLREGEAKQERLRIEIDEESKAFFERYRKPNGEPLEADKVREHTACASILRCIERHRQEVEANRRKYGVRRLSKAQVWEELLRLYGRAAREYRCREIGNVRHFERVLKRYCKEGAKALISGKTGNDNGRVVNRKIENLLLALYRMKDKPFVEEVCEDYNDFLRGRIEVYDKATGEVYQPADFRDRDGNPLEVSKTTVWRYLKDIANYTAVYQDRNGRFDYTNTMRPKHYRRIGEYSMSKITVDDVALSRQSVRGWVYKYQATDVVSGYIFRPAYIIGKPTVETVEECFRNMFCECLEMGLPVGGQLDAEHHLIQDMEWLGEIFPFVYLNPTAWSKRAEHTNRLLKYGVSKRRGHIRGRWYARHEAYRSVRNKVKGDFVEEQSQPQTIVADDLADIDEYNNQLHPKQKTFPGMTRKDVLLKHINPEIKGAERWRLYRYIGNRTECTIIGNDFVRVEGGEYEIKDLGGLERMKPNSRKVEAYHLPEADGRVEIVYLYQGETYIGEAENRQKYRYNENTIEHTEQDKDNIRHQAKRVAKFDHWVRERREEIGRVGKMQASRREEIEATAVEIVESEQPKGYDLAAEMEQDIDYAQIAFESL